MLDLVKYKISQQIEEMVNSEGKERVKEQNLKLNNISNNKQGEHIYDKYSM